MTGAVDDVVGGIEGSMGEAEIAESQPSKLAGVLTKPGYRVGHHAEEP